MRRFWRVTKDVWWGMVVGGGIVIAADTDAPWPIGALVYFGGMLLASVAFYWAADKDAVDGQGPT